MPALESTVEVSKAVRRFSSHVEQEAATIQYWNSRSIADKMRDTAELVEFAYRQKGIDLNAQGPNRSLVRVQQPWS